MSKRKGPCSVSRYTKSKNRGPSIVVVISVAAALLMSYLVGETVFATRPHPAHWGIALLAGIIGAGSSEESASNSSGHRLKKIS